jgi:hypothetical protein
MLDAREISVNARLIALDRQLHRLQTFPVLLSPSTRVTFLGYGRHRRAPLLFVRSFFTETKGRSLEQIEADLQERSVRPEARPAATEGSI